VAEISYSSFLDRIIWEVGMNCWQKIYGETLYRDRRTWPRGRAMALVIAALGGMLLVAVIFQFVPHR